jgi:hypothetical protein
LAPKIKKADRDAADAKGTAFVSAPDGVTGAGVEGSEYQADDQGVLEVASEHVAALVERGFTAL